MRSFSKSNTRKFIIDSEDTQNLTPTVDSLLTLKTMETGWMMETALGKGDHNGTDHWVQVIQVIMARIVFPSGDLDGYNLSQEYVNLFVGANVATAGTYAFEIWTDSRIC